MAVGRRRANWHEPRPTYRDHKGSEDRSPPPEAAPCQARLCAAIRIALPKYGTASRNAVARRRSRRFFYTERALDRSGMHIEAELASDQVRQFARPDGFAGAHLSLEKGQDLALDLVWSPRPAFPGHQADDACTLEVGLGLIEGWSGYAIFVGHLGHRHFVDGHATQHLVLHLYDVARIEETFLPELRIVHLPGCWIERAILGQSTGS